MASTNHREDSALKTSAPSKMKNFNFYQAVQLLEKLAAQEGKTLKLTPKLSMAYTSGDVAELKTDDNQYHLLLNFLSLYDSGSPLPTYYLEELLDKARLGDYSAQDFLDIFHQRLYKLLFEVWEKYHFVLQLLNKSEKESPLMQELLSLSGLSLGDMSPLLEEQPGLNKYIACFQGKNKSLLTLQSLLHAYFSQRVSIQSFYEAPVPIVKAQYNGLGQRNNKLASSCYLGEEFNAINSNILIHFQQLDREAFNEFMPNSLLYKQLVQILKQFLNRPLNCYLRLSLQAKSVVSKRLGTKERTALGQNCWLGQPTDAVAQTLTMQLKFNR
jgi:type VI secretion system protein ImpH